MSFKSRVLDNIVLTLGVIYLIVWAFCYYIKDLSLKFLLKEGE